ncbi:MAG: DUF1015 family protein [Clostridia bacterium]|nr:DUF1015 family protein [Clostridia bacterium]
MKIPFVPADILLPSKVDEAWPVVACDQFTSQPEYWQEAEGLVGEKASTLKMILPEVYLNRDTAPMIKSINATMREYLDSSLFCEYKNAMIYVERTLPDKTVRYGLVGAVDLEAYDFSPETTLPVRATEGTVLSRIPPRVEIRKDAPAELPHVMLLADDPHAKLYTWYLIAMLDLVTMGSKAYENSYRIFNTFWNEYARWYLRTHRSAA